MHTKPVFLHVSVNIQSTSFIVYSVFSLHQAIPNFVQHYMTQLTHFLTDMVLTLWENELMHYYQSSFDNPLMLRLLVERHCLQVIRQNNEWLHMIQWNPCNLKYFLHWSVTLPEIHTTDKIPWTPPPKKKANKRQSIHFTGKYSLEEKNTWAIYVRITYSKWYIINN